MRKSSIQLQSGFLSDTIEETLFEDILQGGIWYPGRCDRECRLEKEQLERERLEEIERQLANLGNRPARTPAPSPQIQAAGIRVSPTALAVAGVLVAGTVAWYTFSNKRK